MKPQLTEILALTESLVGAVCELEDTLAGISVTTTGGLRITVEIPATKPRLPEMSTRPRSPPPPPAEGPAVPSPRVPRTGIAHSQDFRSFRVGEVTYALQPDQAKVVQILLEAWKRECPDVSGAYLLTEVEREDATMRQVFRGSSAWKSLIFSGDTRGTYRLNIPEEYRGQVEETQAASEE